MSFVGDLEHLPIVDVIQLLHATRKSGTLCLKSSKGESQLVFSDGCIVSANHSNNSVRIGQILVQMGKISRETLDETLIQQKRSGPVRIPLIASLIESGRINKEDAFKGLETLIEMTIVEVLTWTEGTFELDVDTSVISDEYRYIPENLKLDLNLNTQNVLMDALRIYDEKKRDGTLMTETFADEPSSFETASNDGSSHDEEQIISIDDLGLDVMDDLEKVIPGFFTPVKVHDPNTIHREKTGTSLGDIPLDQQEHLFAYLSKSRSISSESQNENSPPPTHALILFSASEFIRHTVMTACKQEGFFTFSTDEEVNLEHIINQSVSKDLQPVILLDQPDTESGRAISDLSDRIIAKHPDIPLFHLINPVSFDSILTAMDSGARAVLPRPESASGTGSFVDDTIRFLETVKKCLKVTPVKTVDSLPDALKECMNEISSKKELPEIIPLIDRYVSSVMGRAVTFVHRRNELICECISRSEAVQPLNLSLPIDGDSPLHKAMSTGAIFFDFADHPLLAETLYAQIGAPADNKVLAAPFKCLGRVLAVSYGDSGSRHHADIDPDLITILMRHAGLVYENALYRKKFEKMLQAQHQS